MISHMAGIMMCIFAVVVVIPIAVIREKLYTRKHKQDINMKKRGIVLFVIRSILITITVLVGWFIYTTGYQKHVINTYENDQYKLVIYQVGEPDFPFGATYCSLELSRDDNKIDEMEAAIHNDGKRIDSENFDVVWMENGVAVTTHGEEQDDRTYVLYFDKDIVHVPDKPQKFNANLVQWGDDCFWVRVCDPLENEVFPKEAELRIDFTEGTYFIDLDGTEVAYNPHRGLFEPTAEKRLKWVEGMVLEIEFTSYGDFNMDNGFRNHATAGRIENVDVIAIPVSQ